MVPCHSPSAFRVSVTPVSISSGREGTSAGLLLSGVVPSSVLLPSAVLPPSGVVPSSVVVPPSTVLPLSAVLPLSVVVPSSAALPLSAVLPPSVVLPLSAALPPSAGPLSSSVFPLSAGSCPESSPSSISFPSSEDVSVLSSSGITRSPSVRYRCTVTSSGRVPPRLSSSSQCLMMERFTLSGE